MNPSATDIAKALGIELRLARVSLRFTQARFATKIRMPASTYNCYEQGIRPLPIPTLFKICSALNVTAAEIIERTDQRLTSGRSHLCPYCKDGSGS